MGRHKKRGDGAGVTIEKEENCITLFHEAARENEHRARSRSTTTGGSRSDGHAHHTRSGSRGATIRASGPVLTPQPGNVREPKHPHRRETKSAPETPLAREAAAQKSSAQSKSVFDFGPTLAHRHAEKKESSGRFFPIF